MLHLNLKGAPGPKLGTIRYCCCCHCRCCRVVFTFIDGAFVSVFLPHDVDDVSADFEQTQHLIKGIAFQMSLRKSARDRDHVVVI